MLNFIDKAVNYFNPQSGFKRLQARELTAQYEAAYGSNVNTHKPNKRSIGTANQINSVSSTLRDRARYADENNPFVTGVFDELCTNIVGANGIHVEPIPRNHDGKINIQFAKAINEWWNEYELKMDISGERSRSDMELLICRTWLRDGEVFTRSISGYSPHLSYPTTTPFGVMPLEPDFIDSLLADGYIDGIKRNQLSQPVSYMLKIGMDFYPVHASEICHLRFERRLHQNRGTSILHSSLDLLEEVRDYDTAERLKASIAARAAMYIKSNNDESSDRGDYVLGMGNSFQIKNDEEVGVIHAADHAMSTKFRSSQLKHVAAAAQVNASSVSREYDGNYSAQRQELIDSFSRYRVLQRKFIDRITRPNRNSALKLAIMSGQLSVPNSINPSTVFSAIYQAPVMPWIDPQKEATGVDTAIKTGINSKSHYQRERGFKPDEVRNERASELEQDNTLGIVTTSSPQILEKGNTKND